MTSAPPPDLVDELANLAAGVCAADTWLLFPLAGPLPQERSGAGLPKGFPLHILQNWLTETWSDPSASADVVGFGSRELHPWNVSFVAALPLRQDGAIIGALCLINAEDSHLAIERRRALQMIAERLERALRV